MSEENGPTKLSHEQSAVVAWVGPAAPHLNTEWAASFDSKLPPTNPHLLRGPFRFEGEAWRAFLERSHWIPSRFPSLNALADLPAVFLPDDEIAAAKEWLGVHAQVHLNVGSARELFDATGALAEVNAANGLSTEPILRTIMFAAAAAGTEMPFALWFVHAPLLRTVSSS